jgi:hypothetical protein
MVVIASPTLVGSFSFSSRMDYEDTTRQTNFNRVRDWKRQMLKDLLREKAMRGINAL